MRLETYAVFMTSVAVILALVSSVLGIYCYGLEKDNSELHNRLAVAHSFRDRWRDWVTIQKGVIEKNYAYLKAAALIPAFDLWCKESMTPDPELVYKISEALGKKDEIIVEEATVEIIPDDKVVIIAPPKLLAAT